APLRHSAHVPSVPTRRSSDLPRFRPANRCRWTVVRSCPLVCYPAGRRTATVQKSQNLIPTGDTRNMANPITKWLIVAFTAITLRSEEHTSELQSRENLVCRLL